VHSGALFELFGGCTLRG